MKDMEVKKRGWVKNVAIIFLAVMLVLTFFSNTIMNRSLPEVAAQYTTSGSITASIRGSGTGNANEIYEVTSSQTRTVSEVRVRVDDEVSIGDVLLTLTGSESEELGAAQEALHEHELELERKLLEITRPDGTLATANRDIQRAHNAVAEAQRELARIPYSEAAITQAQTALNYAQAALNQAQAAIEPAKNKLNAAMDLARAKLLIFNLAQQALDSLEPPDDPPNSDYIQATKDRDEAKVALIIADAAVDDAQAAVNNVQTAIDNASATVAARQLTLDLQLGYRETWFGASSSVRQAQQTLEDMVFGLNLSQAEAGVDSSLEAIELRELRRQIQEKREEIAKLKEEGSGTEITSLVGGVVKQVNISPGNQTVAGDLLIAIEIVDRGYSLRFPVSSAQSSKVNVGDFAEVDRFYHGRGEEITAVLVAIRNDPENPVVGRLLEFAIRGDVESGIQLNLTLAQRTENYNIIVPNSALRSDTNGDFVLVVMSKSSPLGNRYIATRADVNILASDDTHTAVSGALSGWDFVITTSTKPIEPGMQIRLVDNP